MDYDVWGGSAEACVNAILESIGKGEKRWLACLNPHSIVVANNYEEFQNALKSASWLVPDGAGVVFASRLMGKGVSERVTGSDVFFGINDAMHSKGAGRIFFLGSTEDTLAAIRTKFSKNYPNLDLVGTYSPPFEDKFDSDAVEKMINAVNRAKPDVLWVGMTAPKQELWIQSVMDQLDVRFVAAIGAVFDFYTGKIKRPSPMFQRFGLEWFPRLLREPKRLWKRTFISGPVFIWLVLKTRFTQKTTA